MQPSPRSRARLVDAHAQEILEWIELAPARLAWPVPLGLVLPQVSPNGIARAAQLLRDRPHAFAPSGHHTCGVADILVAVTDGLKGMPEALAAVFPATTLQTCIVHLIRNSLDYASWKDRKLLAAAIKPIYTAPSAEAAQAELDAFEQGPWGRKFPTVVAAWRRAWDRGTPFFAFPPAVRRVIYTTNAIESINARLRKIIKSRGHFPSDDAATKLIWLALRNITADWGRALTTGRRR